MSIEAVPFLILCAAMPLVALAERARPLRPGVAPPRGRTAANLVLAVCGWVVTPIVVPVIGIGAAFWARAQGLGLLAEVSSVWLAGLVAVLALDAMHWLRHALLHRIPWLWRIHRVHHSDLDVDWSTGLRFHPAEAVLSAATDAAVIVALGAPPVAVVGYSIATALLSVVQHGNARMPKTLAREVGLFVITPHFHRIHHSSAAAEQDRNFGNLLPWWDRLFGTAVEEPSLPPESMRFGVDGIGADAAGSVLDTLTDPLWSGEGPAPSRASRDASHTA
ncbi:MAG: sterol desaturase family protein [Myxococcota bacterium]|nr:sterol desaturase family protein [Myxococcota bacterium]